MAWILFSGNPLISLLYLHSELPWRDAVRAKVELGW